ncbi:MAG: hypothetical protein AB7F99_07090 [Vicinamibacterales bacterium]
MNLIDTAVLNLTEGFCHWVQRLTGRTNVWLAIQLTNLSIVIYFVWTVAHFWQSAIFLRVFVALFTTILAVGLTQSVFKVSIEASEATAYRRVSKGLRNPRRVRDGFLRILFLSLSVLLLGPFLFAYINLRIWIVLLMYSLIVLTTIVLYLLACDPLPPCTGKVSEWLGQLFQPPAGVPQRAAAPDGSGGRDGSRIMPAGKPGRHDGASAALEAVS